MFFIPLIFVCLLINLLISFVSAIAVINFCNALASYEIVDTDNNNRSGNNNSCNRTAFDVSSLSSLSPSSNKLQRMSSFCTNCYYSSFISSPQSLLSPPSSSSSSSLSTFSDQNHCAKIVSQKRHPNSTSSDVLKFARIFQCPVWIVYCRNKLSHPSNYPPSLSILHEAITYALEWLDRNFWAKLLGDQCRLVDVDLRLINPTIGNSGTTTILNTTNRCHHHHHK